MRKSTRDLIVIVFIFTALFLGCFLLVRYLDIKESRIGPGLSIENEVALGRTLQHALAEEFTEVNNKKADSALAVITDRLVSAIGYTPYSYHFRIIESTEVNAFTIPGGNIYIFSGLIKATKTPEELAAVLAHEIGHAEKRHTVTKLVNEMSLAVLVSVITGGDPSLITQIIHQSINNTFSRELETEADEYALRLLETARIDPKNLANFFEELNALGLDYNEHLEFLMTHPHNDSRIETAKNYQTKSDFEAAAFDLDWTKMKDYVGADKNEVIDR